MTKPRYLGCLYWILAKRLCMNFSYDYIKPKYGDRAKLCYTDTDSFVINIITEDFFEDISNDAERWFDTSNYAENDKRSLPISKNKKVASLFKDELGGKIITDVVALRQKTWAYLTDDGSCLKITKIACLMKKTYLKNNKDLKAFIIICTQKKLIRLR